MSATVVSRMWAWRTFVWAGVVGSVVAWAWVWLAVGGVSAVMLLIAVASVVLALRGAQGMRAALGGLVVVGSAMFLVSLFWLAMLLMQGSQDVTAQQVLTMSVFPMVAAVLLLLGAASGFRHAAST